MNSAKLRQTFLEYFVQQGHTVVPSSSLVPGHDPTLLFTNAGMVQFKEVFLGQDIRPYTRAASVQKCLRAGGKHNDLDNVGYTARHHTFFEMLGNFSFGDYFKRDAIRMAWKFLTEILEIPVSRLWVTVYTEDDEAAQIWRDDIGVSPDRFSRCGASDNFWSMGETGPCGPCSEIFYDHGPAIAGGPPGSLDAEGDRYIEIWNLVFMQYNRDKKGVLHPLPKPAVDTGMGLERLAAVLQHVHNNYDSDLFQGIIHHIMTVKPGLSRQHPSIHVVADHIRACAFLLADGVIPSHEGRGYVLRRIIRRAVRHGYALGLPLPFFYQLVAPLLAIMGQAYPELVDNQALIVRYLTQEEEQFARTLEQGLRLLQRQMHSLGQQDIPGDVAFKLYDTYGFPLDLTADIAREQGVAVDILGFERCMQQQQAQSQSASQFTWEGDATVTVGVTSPFQGYEYNEAHNVVKAIVQNGQLVDTLQAGASAAVILEASPFYAQAGGQVGDTGTLVQGDICFQVKDTQQHGSAIWHYGQLLRGPLQVGQLVLAKVDALRRDAIRLHHSATHLLHAALRQCLGSHVQQNGSLVEAQRARFDFTHGSAVSRHELQAIEALINQQIRANHPIETTLMSLEEARQSGAAALFGEKYGETVRVLTMGHFSKELCGGTHARRTGDLGLFKITAEYGVASGVRRIEFVTGAEALDWLDKRLEILDTVARQLKTEPNMVPDKLGLFLQTLKQQEKDLADYHQQALRQESQRLAAQAQIQGDLAIVIQQLDHSNPEHLRKLLDQLKSRLDNAIIVLFAVQDGSIFVVAGVSKALIGQVPTASVLVQQLCGKGGGRPDMAQGGGPVPPDLTERLALLEQLIRQAGR